MSTKHAVRLGSKAVEIQARIALALWAWTAATLLIAALALVHGGAPGAITGATTLALAPAFVGFALLPYLGMSWAVAGLCGVWLVSGVGLIAGTGGFFSPLSAMLLVAPALAHLLQARRLLEISAGAVLSFGAGAALSTLFAPEPVGSFAGLLAVAALGLSAALIVLSRKPAQPPAMSQRVAEISHDLRTPLTHILGFAEMIEKELFGPAGARNVEYAGLIRQSGAHLLDIVNDLLDLSKLDAGRFEIERERFDARMIVDEVVRLSSDAAEKKRIALSSDADSAPIMIDADPRALRRMLMNTVGNAIKFTPEGGAVRIEARAQGDALVLETIDNGPGIPEAERARLGNAYERGESGMHAEGTGLGLALVRALAALHGGALSFHDAPDGGALVRIEMPVVVE